MISIFLNIITIYGCNIQYRERSYYLNQGEFFQIYLEQIFKEENQTFICKGCSNEFQLSNALNQLGNQLTNDHIFLSITSNTTYIVALTSIQNLILYSWWKQELQIVQQIKIQAHVICMNVIYTISNSILIDCYDGFNLYIYQIQEEKQIKLYEQHASAPEKSKIKQILNKNMVYILYAQYYQDFSTLTLFTYSESALTNQTTWDYGLLDFVVSNRLTGINYIYLLCNDFIVLQIEITDENMFQVLAYIYQGSQIFAIQVYRSIKFNSQCDQLLVLQQLRPQFWHYWACPSAFYEYKNRNINITFNNYTNYQIFINDQFFILQQNASIGISSTEAPAFIYLEKKVIFDHFKTYNSLYLFNSLNNQLFEFGKIIQVFQVNFPQLTANLSRNQQIRIYSGDFGLALKRPCRINLTFYVIQSNDTNIYVQYDLKPLNQYDILNTSFFNIITGIQGPLLYYAGFTNDSIGYFIDESLRQSQYQFKMDYYLAQIFYIQQLHKKQCLYITGAKKLEIQMSLCCYDRTCINATYNLSKEQNEIQSIQSVYNLNGQVLTVMDQGTQHSLLLFIVTQLGDLELNMANFNISVPAFYDYQITFNCLILLTAASEILLVSVNGNKQFFLNQQNFGNYFPDLDTFDPKGISINQQFSSSILLINNKKELLILSINADLTLLPLQMIRMEHQIYQVSQVWDDIILAYYCDQRAIYMCFDVWNIGDPFNPKFEKKLRSLIVNELKSITSDNLFMYVQTETNGVLVYNPFQTSHMSPWASFHLNQPYFTSTFVEGFSLIVNYNQIYELSPETVMRFYPNISYYQSSYLQRYTYYYQVKSALNYSNVYLTNNITLNMISSYTNILLNYVVINIEQRQIFTIDEAQVNNESQVYIYQINSLNSKSSDNEISCSIYNAIVSHDNITYNDTYFLVAVINNIFILQNNVQALIIGGIPYKYQTFELLECQATMSYYNYFFTTCQVSNHSIIMRFLFENNAIQEMQNLTLPYFTETQLMSYELEIFFLLSSQNTSKNVYFYNSKNTANQGFITNCEDSNYFAVTNFLNTTRIGLVALFYGCKNQIRYKVGTYDFSTQTLAFDGESKKLHISALFEQRIEYPMQIQILKVLDYELLILITATNFCSVILSMMYSIYQKEFFIQQYLSTIPPLGNYWLLNSQLANQTLMLVFFQPKVPNPELVYALYQLTNFSEFDIMKPIKMIGALTFPQTQAVGIQSKQYQGVQQVLFLKNNSAQIYNLSTFQIICATNIGIFTRSKQFQFQVNGSNSFHSNYSIITLNYQRGAETYLYFLLIIVLTCLAFCFIIYQQRKQQQIRRRQSQTYFEFEL